MVAMGCFVSRFHRDPRNDRFFEVKFVSLVWITWIICLTCTVIARTAKLTEAILLSQPQYQIMIIANPEATSLSNPLITMQIKVKIPPLRITAVY
jgi:hypothetical protein